MRITYYEVSVDTLTERLKPFLEKLPNLEIAVLFGSVLRREFVRDIDIGVYFRPEEDLRNLIKLAGLIEDELGIPVDITPLQRAPPKLRLKALLNGVRLIVRDNSLYWRLASQALAEASDIELKNRPESRVAKR